MRAAGDLLWAGECQWRNGTDGIYTLPTVFIGGKLHQGPASCKRHVCMVFVVLHNKYQRGEHVVPQACDAVQGKERDSSVGHLIFSPNFERRWLSISIDAPKLGPLGASGDCFAGKRGNVGRRGRGPPCFPLIPFVVASSPFFFVAAAKQHGQR